MARQRIVAAGACLAAALSCSPVPSTKLEKDAVAAATAWLKLVDDAQYRQSWDQSAALFRSAVSVDTWVVQVRTVRQPMGPVAARKLETINYTTSLPRAPDGQYVVLKYDTAFANKSGATETVTPMRDPDGAWRVSGYFIE